MIHIVVGPELETYLIDGSDNGFSILLDNMIYESFGNNAVLHHFPEKNRHISKTIGIVNGILNEILLSEVHKDHVIMTHSESIINYVGELIDEGKISRDSVIIHVLYHKDMEQSRHSFDSDGCISNNDPKPWPSGLMSTY